MPSGSNSSGSSSKRAVANGKSYSRDLPGDDLSTKEQAKLLSEEGSELERVLFMDKLRFVGYPFAKQVLARMERLLIQPRRSSSMPCMLISGASGNGKTTLARRFLNLHPKQERTENGDACHIPVLYMEAPARPVLGDFYNEILVAVDAVFNPEDRIGRKARMTHRILEEVGTRVLMIDEIHHIISGSGKRQKVIHDTLKSLSNKRRLPIVALGIKEALDAIKSDPQLDRRFEQQWGIPKWRLDANYGNLLDSFEAALPLKKKSRLADSGDASRAKAILEMSDGTIGDIWLIVKNAAEAAIRSGEERITIDNIGSGGFVPQEMQRDRAWDQIKHGEMRDS